MTPNNSLLSLTSLSGCRAFEKGKCPRSGGKCPRSGILRSSRGNLYVEKKKIKKNLNYVYRSPGFPVENRWALLFEMNAPENFKMRSALIGKLGKIGRHLEIFGKMNFSIFPSASFARLRPIPRPPASAAPAPSSRLAGAFLRRPLRPLRCLDSPAHGRKLPPIWSPKKYFACGAKNT